MKVFSHYIVTRFNIKSEGWVNDKNGKKVNDFIWLKKRYDLFKKFCLPSMQTQTEKEYSWLVFFDKDTPQEFKEVNECIRRELPQFIPLYVNDFLDFENTLREFVFENSHTEYIMTSRFDNDDCFHEDAIGAIQKAFVKKDSTIIELSKGLTMLIEDENKLAKRENVFSGPFITLIEKKSDINSLKTVYDCEHTSWGDLADFIAIDNKFYWLQTIHDANISNKLYPELTINKSLLKGFNFNYNVRFKISYMLFVICKNLGVFRLKNIFKNA
ncbi:glycosyltransferase [Winogradskyella jejuensis]|uniref:Putative rhamnosyl transferase n=1 Tax=Winogradskyella jejuensis TaxID=1089305 RepID=A0A1M5SIG4_9FLAO|nr:glycosyltransferase [Winogradskyella jejuensis]SHH38377.1 Putative rhamnosyl transferase [Winogradskyella jejuensis]